MLAGDAPRAPVLKKVPLGTIPWDSGISSRVEGVSDMFEGIERRSRMIGNNRLELLLFRLCDGHTYGINVFKVREVVRTPELTPLPGATARVRGVTMMRGQSICVMDLTLAVGCGAFPDAGGGYVIVTEFNRTVQGLLVQDVERIVSLDWEAMLPVPEVRDGGHYLTAVTRVDDRLVGVLDVERVLVESASGEAPQTSVAALQPGPAPEPPETPAATRRLFVVDDSRVARRQIANILEPAGFTLEFAENGQEALERLCALAAEVQVAEYFVGMVSDVEMPRMDGYTLVREIKARAELRDLWVMLHSSLSAMGDPEIVRTVGADDFLAKFDADELRRRLLARVEQASHDAEEAA